MTTKAASAPISIRIDLAPRPAPGGHRQRGGKADGERRARRGEAEQQPEGGERGEAELGGDEGLHGGVSGGSRWQGYVYGVNYAMMLSMSTSNRSSYHHGALRPALIAAARALLDEGGPDAVGLREAARRVGVSRDRHLPPFQGQGRAAGGAGGRGIP